MSHGRKIELFKGWSSVLCWNCNHNLITVCTEHTLWVFKSISIPGWQFTPRNQFLHVGIKIHTGTPSNPDTLFHRLHFSVSLAFIHCCPYVCNPLEGDILLPTGILVPCWFREATVMVAHSATDSRFTTVKQEWWQTDCKMGAFLSAARVGEKTQGERREIKVEIVLG